MAKPQKKTSQTKTTSTSFLGCCFGYSSKPSNQKSAEIIRSDGQKKTRSRWYTYSWYKFRMKKSGAKTVPVESTLSEKANPKNKFPKPKSKSKSDKLATSKRVTNHKPPSQIPVVVPVASDHQAPQEKPEETTYGPARNIILEKRDHADRASKEDTCQKRSSFCRKIAIRAGSNQPGSPEAKPKLTRPASISHSASLPVSFPDKRVANPSSSTLSRGTLKKPARKKDELSEKLDPVIGLSIVMVTLIIMLLWGRICAILCTSAWFYFVPRLANVTKSDDVVGKNPNSRDYDSEEYKKKVVLEGFLERNHRNGGSL